MTPEQRQKSANLSGAVQKDIAPEDVKGHKKPETVPNCYTCGHLHTCNLQLNLYSNLVSFCDFDKPGGGEWLTKLNAVIAERCRHFQPKIK